jgi:hypothetical protein
MAAALDLRKVNSSAIRALRGDRPAEARWLGAASRNALAMRTGARIIVFTEGVRGGGERSCSLAGPKTAGQVMDAILLTEHAPYAEPTGEGAASRAPAGAACAFCAPAAGDAACTARPREGFCGLFCAGGHWQGALSNSRFLYQACWSAPFCAASGLAANGEDVNATGSNFFSVERCLDRAIKEREDAGA